MFKQTQCYFWHRTTFKMAIFGNENVTDEKHKATGWLGALVRVTNLKFWFLRLRDKMLVFAGVVKKRLQHGHSFRLAGVWLKSENLRFACAVTRFCSSRVKKNIRNLWFSIIWIKSGRHSLFQFFPLLDASVPERLWQRRSHRLQQGSIVTPCPAIGPSVSYIFYLDSRAMWARFL